MYKYVAEKKIKCAWIVTWFLGFCSLIITIIGLYPSGEITLQFLLKHWFMYVLFITSYNISVGIFLSINGGNRTIEVLKQAIKCIFKRPEAYILFI